MKVDQPEFKATWFDPYSSTVAAGLRFSLMAATQIDRVIRENLVGDDEI